MINHYRPFTINAVLFDFDGTLTRPGALDFAEIRAAVGCPPERAILEFIAALPEHRLRQRAFATLETYENNGADRSVPNRGAEDVILELRKRGLKLGIISRNGRAQIHRAFANFSAINSDHFDVILTRDDPIEPKPDPAGIFMAAERFGVPPAEILVVGDYVFDIDAGNRAGAVTVYLKNPGVSQKVSPVSDATITSLDELTTVVQLGRPLNGGKLPNVYLSEFFDNVEDDDPSLVIKPGVGQDTAAVKWGPSDDLLVLKSDPITFVAENIGHYAVLINANDMATSGATPRWMLTTLLFPPGFTPSRILATMADIRRHCRQWGIRLCGGHTEVTPAVSRPLVAATLIGTVPPTELIDKQRMRPGDQVLMTKGVAVEGTAILGNEFQGHLKRAGLSAKEIDAAARFQDQISILDEAGVSRRYGADISALHDVTEGGVATALEELAFAGNHQIRIDVSRIPVYPLTRKICDRLGLNPFGLIGSGSLLICCRASVVSPLTRDMAVAGIDCTRIGEVEQPGNRVRALDGDRPIDWPSFGADELTRLSV